MIRTGLRAAALVVGLAMLVTALHDVSQAWDSGYYHLPFAARLAGILPADGFVFHPANQARFEGYPLLGERLQGLLWRLTGRAEAANLVALASLPLLALFARRCLGVPVSLTVLGLLAIPLVQTHATSAYVDLPANAALSVVILLAIRAFALRASPSRTVLLASLGCAAIATNMKVLLHPLVALALAALAVRALPAIVRELRHPSTRRRAAVTLAAILVALPLVAATPIANLARHGNPYYPERISLLGRALPGAETPYASSPPWLRSAPRPVRFACSLLEIGIRPMNDEHRWTVDQWMPDDSLGNRMGGFFGAYVIFNLALLGFRAIRERTREARAAGIGFLSLTAAVSVMPQSHELRYYQAWMIVLVVLNLWLACLPGGRQKRIAAHHVGVVALACFAIVATVTHAAYILPSGSRFEALTRAKVDPATLDGIGAGERVCVRREPWNLLWAAAFHPPKSYVVVEAEDPAECGGARRLE